MTNTTPADQGRSGVTFKVGPFEYTCVLSDRPIYDAEGNPLEGIALEGPRLIVLSSQLEPERREEVAFHELIHAWEFHVPAPRDAEERCQFGAFIQQQFDRELAGQGGRDVLLHLKPRTIRGVGTPKPQSAQTLDLDDKPSSKQPGGFNPFDRMPCHTCDADVMCGSIHSSEPVPDAAGRFSMQRWFRCEACGSVQIWHEWCTSEGVPTGVIVQVPRPRVLQGYEAKQFIAGESDSSRAKVAQAAAVAMMV